jgi:hypothetical protein
MNFFDITGDDISRIHNAKCALLQVKAQCDSMFKEDSPISRNLALAMQYLEPVANGLMKSKDDYHDRLDQVANGIKQQLGIKHTIWSIYKKQLQEKHPFAIGTKLTSYYTDQIGVVTGPTYADLWKDVDVLADLDEDHFGTHIFIEGFDMRGGVVEVNLGS